MPERCVVFGCNNVRSKEKGILLHPISFYGKREEALKDIYRSFSHDVTAAILVYQNNETAAILVYQTNPVGVKLFSYVKTFFCSNKFA